MATSPSRSTFATSLPRLLERSTVSGWRASFVSQKHEGVGSQSHILQCRVSRRVRRIEEGGPGARLTGRGQEECLRPASTVQQQEDGGATQSATPLVGLL